MAAAALIAKNRIMVLLIAAVVDLIIGDPVWLWHPVQGIGALISLAEKWLRRVFHVPVGSAEEGGSDSSSRLFGGIAGAEEGADTGFHLRERIAGAVMVLLVLAVSTGVVLLLLNLCSLADPWRKGFSSPLRTVAEGILCGRLLALRSLGEAGFSVRDPLLAKDVEGARKAVSMIVGRDTERLDEEGIAKAAVETVAENTSDGVTAPLFYMLLFGGLGGIFYKTVNTMDSMTGYLNDRYRYFGTAAARLDDIMNFIPSRLTALFMIAASGSDMHAAYRIWLRDRKKSPSPNSAQTESVCAGALHLRLLGDTWYFGELHHKEEIGNGDHPAGPEDITRAVHLLYRTSFLMYAVGMAALILVAI